MLKSLSTLLLFLIAQITVAQTDEYRILAIPQGADLFGYANLKGEMVIAPQFVQAFGFDPSGVTAGFPKDLKPFRMPNESRDKKFAFFDANGNTVPASRSIYLVGQKFNFAREMRAFFDGVFVASSNENLTDRFGVNHKGEIVTKTHYSWLSNFNSGMAIGKHRSKGFVVVRPNEKDTPISGAKVIKSKNPTEGLAPVRAENNKWGFVDINGEWVIEAQFNDVGHFWGEHCWARNEKNLFGFIDKNGEWVIQPKFKKAKDLDPTSGIAMVVEKRDWLYVSLDGTIRAGEPKEKLYGYSEGLAVKRDAKTKKVGCIDANGDWVIDAEYETIRPFLHGFAAAKQGKLWGLLDKKGDWVIEPKFVKMMDAYPINTP